MSVQHKKIIWPVLCIIAASVSAAWFLHANARAKPLVTADSKESAPGVPQDRSQKQRFEGEIIGIQPHGFQPEEITRPKGKFFLIVDNHSGIAEVNLRLDQEQGIRLREVRAKREDRDWTDQLDLTPGRYVLSEENHPNWVCHITITP